LFTATTTTTTTKVTKKAKLRASVTRAANNIYARCGREDTNKSTTTTNAITITTKIMMTCCQIQN